MAVFRALDVLVVFDLACAVRPEEYQAYLRTEEWRVEREIGLALRKLGHRAYFLGVYDSLAPLLSELVDPPDIVFNLAESFQNDRARESFLPELLDHLGIAYTGEAAATLTRCKDKARAKRLVAEAGVPVPLSQVVRVGERAREGALPPFPLVVKPLFYEASEGVSAKSLVDNSRDLLSRVRYVHRRWKCSALVEAFIPGRDCYAAFSSGEVFPARELAFRVKNWPAGGMATHHLKWNEKYRKKYGVFTRPHRWKNETFSRRFEADVRRAAKALGIKSTARLDFRLTDEGKWFFLEANPNPSLGKGDDFALSAHGAGYTYESLIDSILRWALKPQKVAKAPSRRVESSHV